MYAKFQFSGFAWSCSQDAEIKKTPDHPPPPPPQKKKKKICKIPILGVCMVMFPRCGDKKHLTPSPPPPPKKKKKNCLLKT